jgi:hypothetical protein
VLADLAARSVRHLSILLFGLLPVTLAAADALVAHVLPQYAPALPSLRIYVAGLFPLALSLPLRNLLVTVGAERSLLRAQVVLLAAAATLCTAAALTDEGIRGVSFVTALVSASLLASVLVLSTRRRVMTGRAARKGAAWAVGALAGALSIDAAISSMAPPPSELSGALVRVALTGVVALGAAAWVTVRSRKPE